MTHPIPIGLAEGRELVARLDPACKAFALQLARSFVGTSAEAEVAADIADWLRTYELEGVADVEAFVAAFLEVARGGRQ